MAGFGIFRSYQKASMVALAILSMLAFFVLPPLLQYGGQAASVADAPVARWKGGELREKSIDRAVTMKLVVNRFLGESMAAAGRDPAQAPRFPADEQAVVRTMILAEEARKNGLVVSDDAINDFLAKVTAGQVRAEQFEQILAGLPAGVSQQDLFDAIRTELLAQNMLIFLQRGFSGDPPGMRWDYFRRMEQSATVEVVAVDVRSVGDSVTLPPVPTLRTFYETHKDDLPDPRSDEPGFREPHRAKVQSLVAKAGVFADEIAKEITDAEIAEFYEKNKATMFRARPNTPATGASVPDGSPPSEGASPAAPETPAESAAPVTPAGTAPADTAPTDPAAATPAEGAPAATEPPPAEGTPPAAPKEEPASGEPGAAEPATTDGAAKTRSPFRTVAFQEPDPGADAAAPAAPAAEQAPATPPLDAAATTVEPAAPATDAAAPATDGAAAPEGAPPADGAEAQFEPLDAVKDRIRDQISRERANARVDNVFNAVAGDIDLYNQNLALWQARGGTKPNPPDLAVIAEKQGLEGATSELQSAEQAFDAGGLGRSFEFVPDPGSRFGVRQLNWIEMIYGEGAQGMRPVRSRDMEGNRYLSWRVEDQPEFTPTFEAARPAVEAAWKIVEGRGAARKRAEEIAAKAAGAESLEAAIAGDETLQSLKVGPFFWMNPQAAMSGMAQVSQPAGLVMPGDEFMSTAFSLEPGAVGVAFNEPKTVCYVVRLIDIEPTPEKLKERFIATRGDPRLVGVAAQEDFSRSFGGWIEGLEERYGLEWKRKPRR